MLQLHAELADPLLGLDEGAPHIMIANDAKLEGQAKFMGIADGGGHAQIRNRDDHIGIGWRFLRRFGPSPFRTS